METAMRLYDRVDAWLRDLSRVPYAAILGTATGLGVLVVGAVLGSGLLVGQAVTMAVVVFGLECVFGLYQTDE
ncbi:hypothetical protein [Halomicrobium katesii]|uniref:hypothetical protein n=1 Tax=Halomicrobium katesii TaxID=437163 RepID=UPI0003734299|nr:hypothetical protein [Halomicrobium katesii]